MSSENIKVQFIEAMKEGLESEFIHDHAFELGTDVLIEILDWYMYAISYTSRAPKKEGTIEEDIREQVIDNLEGEWL